jgi:hypothetical protein
MTETSNPISQEETTPDEQPETEQVIVQEDQTVAEVIAESVQEPEPAPLVSVSDTLLKPLSEVELLVNKALSDGDSSLKSVVEVCAEYRFAMQPNKITDKETIRLNQLAFFRMVKEVLASPSYFNEGLRLLLQYMREDHDGKGALSVPFLMRGFDDDTLSSMQSDNRALFWALVTLLTTAAGLNDPKQTYRQVSMKAFQSSVALKPTMKQRLVSFFSA